MGVFKNIFKQKSAIDTKIHHLSFVDGLRGVAILMVLVVHVSGQIGAQNYVSETLHNYILSGSRGVQLFFILSAFTLFASSKTRFAKEKYPKANFYLRRFFRIYPFWFMISVFWALYNHVELKYFLASITFLFGFLRFNVNYDLVPGGWTLFVEESFYLFLPLIFLKINNLWKAFGFTAALFLLSDIWVKLFTRVEVLNQNNFVILAPPAQWFVFGLGIIAYYLYVNKEFMKKVINNKEAILLLNALSLMGLWFIVAKDIRYVAVGLLFLVLASFSEKTIMGRLSRNKLLGRYGKYSYSIYLLHFVFLFTWPAQLLINKFLNYTGLLNSPLEIRFALIFPIFCIFMLGVGWLSYRFIEGPSILFGKRVIKIFDDKNILHLKSK